MICLKRLLVNGRQDGAKTAIFMQFFWYQDTGTSCANTWFVVSWPEICKEDLSEKTVQWQLWPAENVPVDG